MDGLHNIKDRHAEYLAKAQEARDRAENIKDPETRRTWLEIGASWQALAEQLGRTAKM